MYYVYVLKSLRNGKRYIGCTRLKPYERLQRHNWGSNRFTKANKPFILIHKENYQNITLARKRENFLKSGAGRKLLDNLFQLKTDLSQAEK